MHGMLGWCNGLKSALCHVGRPSQGEAPYSEALPKVGRGSLPQRSPYLVTPSQEVTCRGVVEPGRWLDTPRTLVWRKITHCKSVRPSISESGGEPLPAAVPFQGPPVTKLSNKGSGSPSTGQILDWRFGAQMLRLDPWFICN